MLTCKVGGGTPVVTVITCLSKTDVVTFELPWLGTPRSASHSEIPHSYYLRTGVT